MGTSALNNPVCPSCEHVFSWSGALKEILGPSRGGTALWGVLCPSCGADLRVPKSRVMLIVASAIFFGSQSSTVLVLSEISVWQLYAAKIFLIIGFYAIAVFILLKLELVE